MFIRRKKLNKPLSWFVLVAFLLASTAAQLSGSICQYNIKAPGCNLAKWHQTKSSALHYPSSATEEEQKGEQESAALPIYSEEVHSIPKNFWIDTQWRETKNIAFSLNLIFLVNKALRL